MKYKKHFFIFVAFAFGVLTSFCATAQNNNESRMALLIGNANYKTSPLTNPVNDVRLMEAALKDAGFTVTKAENASRRDMLRLIRDFGEKLKASGGVGLFYFAGHGLQVKGTNYLVPVDADIRSEDEVAFDSVDAQSVLEKMETAKNRMNMLILDACRDNPFAKNSRSASNGLATMNAPSGSLVAYATAPGSVASDGSGRNGLYTQHLAAAMRMSDLPIEEVFKYVRANVRKDSANQQTPWENTALEGSFYFKRSPPPPVLVAAVAPTPVVPVAPAPSTMAIELAYWESIKLSNRPFELEAYIDQFPNGSFVGLAKARLREVAREIKAAEDAALRAAAQKAADDAKNAELRIAQQRAAEATRAAEEARLASIVAAQKAPPQLVAMATPTSIAPSVVAAQPLLTASMESISQGQRLGTLILHDRMFNNKTEQNVTVTEKTASYTSFSTGDKIAADGSVLALRFGERILTFSGGQPWKFPLKVGDKGQAEFNMGSSVVSLQWFVRAGTNAQNVVVQAEFGIRGTMAYRSGTWSAEYGHLTIPTNTTYSLRAGTGTLNRPDLMTTSLNQ